MDKIPKIKIKVRPVKKTVVKTIKQQIEVLEKELDNVIDQRKANDDLSATNNKIGLLQSKIFRLQVKGRIKNTLVQPSVEFNYQTK